MWIKNIELFNYRNYDRESFNFIKGVNVLYGLNGQGKTNLVEAINYISTLNSFRMNKSEDIIKKDCDNALIRCENYLGNKIKISILKTKKNIFLDNEEIKKHRDIIGYVNIVSFSSEDITNFKDSPQDRRKFFDVELSKIDKEYLISLIKVKKFIKQRNEILKSKSKYLDDYLDVLDKQIIDVSCIVHLKRIEFINKINNFINEEYKNLTGLDDFFKLVYKSDLDNKTKDDLLELYRTNRKKDEEKGITSFGVHKDDFECFINDLDFLNKLSSGQRRILLLCIKLSVLKIVSDIKKEEPILILDDVFSELDDVKKNKLLNRVKNINQIFITTTSIKEIESVCSNVKYFNIENGIKVSERMDENV